jgi:hypothetical protein
VKSVGNVAQVVQCLPNNCKALNQTKQKSQYLQNKKSNLKIKSLDQKTSKKK